MLYPPCALPRRLAAPVHVAAAACAPRSRHRLEHSNARYGAINLKLDAFCVPEDAVAAQRGGAVPLPKRASPSPWPTSASRLTRSRRLRTC
eukprot:359555-Chlamydomonas_euryale.AAC.8